MAKDFYSILGVEKNASQEVIKKAYKKLAVKHHPDKNPGDAKAEELFKEISEAYATLSNPDKRKAYDAPSQQQGGWPGGINWNVKHTAWSAGGMDDIFSQFFNQKKPKTSTRGNNLHVERTISLKDAAYGCTLEMDLNFTANCGACKGTGGDKKVITCKNCHGSGMEAISQNNFTFASPCRKCVNGEITEYLSKCQDCQGKGTTTNKKRVKVKVPPGVHQGQTISVAGQGSPSTQGGQPGDLLIQIFVKSDPSFEYRDGTLATHVSVPMLTAVLGGDVKVRSLDGSEVEAKVPPGAQSGEVIHLLGKGAPIPGAPSKFGDLMAVIKIVIPKNIPEEARKTLEGLRDVLN